MIDNLEPFDNFFISRCLDLANKICHLFLMGFVPGIFVNVGLFLAFLFSLESRWDVMINSIYPTYLYLFMSGLCLFGQLVINSVRKFGGDKFNKKSYLFKDIFQSDALREAIYECYWDDAPIRFKKLMLLFQIRCERPLIVDLKPFFALNLELLLRVSL